MRQTRFALLIAIALVLTTVAWSREDRLTSTGMTPAAQGKVITSNDRNGNTEVEVQVKHVASPHALTPPHQSYVVWVQPRGMQPQVLGTLRINEDLEGSLKATTTYKEFDVLITAEDNLKPEAPSQAVVLKGSVERR
jgi:hypothetical protein